MRVKVLCGDYSPYSPFIEAGCGYGYDGKWEIDAPSDVRCPGCGATIDSETLNMVLPSLKEHEVTGVGAGPHTFNFSSRTHEPYFAPEEVSNDGEATEQGNAP